MTSLEEQVCKQAHMMAVRIPIHECHTPRAHGCFQATTRNLES